MAVIKKDGTVDCIFPNCCSGRVGVQHLIFFADGLELVEISGEDNGDATIDHVVSSGELFKVPVECFDVDSSLKKDILSMISIRTSSLHIARILSVSRVLFRCAALYIVVPPKRAAADPVVAVK